MSNDFGNRTDLDFKVLVLLFALSLVGLAVGSCHWMG